MQFIMKNLVNVGFDIARFFILFVISYSYYIIRNLFLFLKVELWQRSLPQRQ